jgi:hypothetical protein
MSYLPYRDAGDSLVWSQILFYPTLAMRANAGCYCLQTVASSIKVFLDGDQHQRWDGRRLECWTYIRLSLALVQRLPCGFVFIISFQYPVHSAGLQIMYARIFSFVLWVGLVSASALAPRSLCSNVSFTIPVTAQNGVYSGVPDASNAEEIVSYVAAIFTGGLSPPIGSQSVSDVFIINGLYCKPLLGNPNKLQVLVHGITYNKDYWSGLGFGDLYNWHPFANLHGYATLAVDRVGHGSNPQRPDPFNVVQAPVHVETLHQIIRRIRTSTANPLGRTFNKIGYVCTPTNDMGYAVTLTERKGWPLLRLLHRCRTRWAVSERHRRPSPDGLQLDPQPHDCRNLQPCARFCPRTSAVQRNPGLSHRQPRIRP